MRQRLTAAQARDLDPESLVDVWLDKIDIMIDGAARQGRKFIRLPEELTRRGGGGEAALVVGIGEAVAKSLEHRGFTVRGHYDQGQFVDSYITIRWEAK